jgi:hypothetical protein
MENMWLRQFDDHRYNVSPIYLRAFLGVVNFTEVVRVCGYLVCSGPRLPKFDKH